MINAGFAPYEYEWWHFTLCNEPYPDTFFDFPVGKVEG
jgi:D-alanyl-D-alanine dipeptidase